MDDVREVDLADETPLRGDLCVQGGTASRASRRGHRLKVPDRIAVREVHPECPGALTGDAGENLYMDAANHRLGFGEVGRNREMQWAL